MLSILGGEWSGRKLKVPDSEKLRPSSGRVKAAIFSIIEAIAWKRMGQPNYSQWRCLDLFAGVGGLGLEMLSRGAKDCVFVEQDRRHGQYLKENIHTVGAQERALILQEPVEKGTWVKQGPFDLVLLDPPYDYSAFPVLLAQVVSLGATKPGSIVVAEHDPKAKMPVIDGLVLHSERKLGPAGISVFFRDESLLSKQS